MKNYQHFYFSRKEKKALQLFGFIIICLLLIMYLVYKYDKPSIYHISELAIKEEPKSFPGYVNHASRTQKRTMKAKLFKFNPNTVSRDSLKLLGVDEKSVGNLLKYRSKGGTIKNKEHFYRIYGMKRYQETLDSLISFETYTNEHVNRPGEREDMKRDSIDQLSNNSIIDSNRLNFRSKNNQFSKIPVQKLRFVEINSCDSFELELIKGIGPTLAKRIIKYRDKLGGFYEVEQLEEVYGLKPESYMLFNHLLKIDVEKIRRIKINQASYEDVSSHPYIGRKIGSILIRYRNNHGKFEGIEDLKKSKLFDDEEIEKLLHYLDFE